MEIHITSYFCPSIYASLKTYFWLICTSDYVWSLCNSSVNIYQLQNIKI